MRLISSVVAMWGFALVLGGCGGSGDGGGGRACYFEESGTMYECRVFVGDIVASDDWFKGACPTGPGVDDYKEGTSCPMTGNYLGQCRYFPGEPREQHEYYYDIFTGWEDGEYLKVVKEECTESGGVWVGW